MLATGSNLHRLAMSRGEICFNATARITVATDCDPGLQGRTRPPVSSSTASRQVPAVDVMTSGGVHDSCRVVSYVALTRHPDCLPTEYPYSYTTFATSSSSSDIPTDLPRCPDCSQSTGKHSGCRAGRGGLSPDCLLIDYQYEYTQRVQGRTRRPEF